MLTSGLAWLDAPEARYVTERGYRRLQPSGHVRGARHERTRLGPATALVPDRSILLISADDKQATKPRIQASFPGRLPET
jgi:hypothetical protein